MPYATVGTLDVHYTEHGHGDPLVLLHGGMLTTELCFGDLIPALAPRRRVVAVDLQGHGHTADSAREITLPALADDVVAVLDHLGLARADLLGFSLGGMVALETALRHAGRVGRLVIASVHTRADGYHDDIRDPALFATSTRMPTDEDFAAMTAAYERIGLSTFDTVAAKVGPIVEAEENWSPARLAGLTAPTLTMIGDHDFVRVTHAESLRDAIPDARLAVVPGTTHNQLTHRVGIVAPIVEDFLGAADRGATEQPAG